jgi:DNA-binding XRE family transcriptional regulator
MTKPDRLSALDSTFLHLEDDSTAHMPVATQSKESPRARLTRHGIYAILVIWVPAWATTSKKSASATTTMSAPTSTARCAASISPDAGITQKQLAEASGISQADISRYERGLGNPTRATIDALAVALGAHLELVRNSEPLQAVTA